MFPRVHTRPVRQLVTSLAAAAVLATSTIHATPTQAAGPDIATRALPVATTAEGVHADTRADLVVIFQGSKTHFYGTVMTYTVANAMPNPAHNVAVTKTVKVAQIDPQNTLAAPVVENIGTLKGYEVREFQLLCGAALQNRCTGSAVSAKTFTPEVIYTNNGAGVTF